MPGRCGSSPWTPEIVLGAKPTAGLPHARGRAGCCHPAAPVSPRLRTLGYGLLHETESGLPISLDERGLSVDDSGHEKTLYAAKEEEECAQNTQRNTTLWGLRTADSVPPLSAVSLPRSLSEKAPVESSIVAVRQMTGDNASSL